MKLIIVAQNPKTSKNVRQPLVGTPSGKTLDSWLKRAKIPKSAVVLLNTYDDMEDITYGRVKGDVVKGKWDGLVTSNPVIVTLGLVAAEAVNLTAVKLDFSGKYFYLPHPSGLNRKLNDKAVVKDTIEKLKRAYALIKEST